MEKFGYPGFEGTTLRVRFEKKYGEESEVSVSHARPNPGHRCDPSPLSHGADGYKALPYFSRFDADDLLVWRVYVEADCSGKVALISVVSIFLVIVAISKRKFQDEVIRSNEVSIRILAEKKLGRIARANGELGKAKQHFQNAADLGDEHSRKILRLMSQCEK